VGVAMLLYTIGPKLITAAEVTLLCLLEPCVAPLWVWAGTGEVPSRTTVVAGCVLLCSLAGHEVLAMRESELPEYELEQRKDKDVGVEAVQIQI
tara:strand:- start:139 stop:420 length:282 start_codon:yes stop_codon:yes gene_type:complete